MDDLEGGGEEGRGRGKEGERVQEGEGERGRVREWERKRGGEEERERGRALINTSTELHVTYNTDSRLAKNSNRNDLDF